MYTNGEFSMELTFEKTQSQVSASVGEDEAVLQTVSGVYYTLNPVARDIWKFLDSPRKVYEIVDYVMDEYEVDYQTCVIAVRDLLVSLSEYGLICVKVDP